jgi:Xaa-Pro aminopeptidase
MQNINIFAIVQVAWLYNIRGSDVSYCPVVHAFAIVTSNLAFLYVDKRKASSEVSYKIQFFDIFLRYL